MLECIITSVFARLSLIFMQSCNTNASTMGINIDRTYIQAWTCIWFPNEMFVKNNVAKKKLREMLLASGNSLTRGQGLGGRRYHVVPSKAAGVGATDTNSNTGLRIKSVQTF